MKKYIYLFQSTKTKEYKIGVSNNPERRKKELETGHGAPIIIVKKILSETPFQVEAKLHSYFRMERRDGEFFNLLDDDVERFDYLCNLFEGMCKKYECYDL